MNEHKHADEIRRWSSTNSRTKLENLKMSNHSFLFIVVHGHIWYNEHNISRLKCKKKVEKSDLIQTLLPNSMAFFAVDSAYQSYLVLIIKSSRNSKYIIPFD